jgi:hypothetical protein
MRHARVLLCVVSVLLASSCAEPIGDERLARQASLGMTIEYQALRFADRVLTDAVDCSASPEANALAIAATIECNLGSCAEVLQRGSGVDVTTGASCDFGFDTIASLATEIAVSREGEELVFSFELPRARINGLDAVGSMVLRTHDCGAYRASMDLVSNEYTITTPDGAPLEVTLSSARSSVRGMLDVEALSATAGLRELSIDNDTIAFDVGDCWPRGGALRGLRAGAGGAMVTITFDATTVELGHAHIAPSIAGSAFYELPMYGPCPDTRP